MFEHEAIRVSAGWSDCRIGIIVAGIEFRMVSSTELGILRLKVVNVPLVKGGSVGSDRNECGMRLADTMSPVLSVDVGKGDNTASRLLTSENTGKLDFLSQKQWLRFSELEDEIST